MYVLYTILLLVLSAWTGWFVVSICARYQRSFIFFLFRFFFAILVCIQIGALMRVGTSFVVYMCAFFILLYVFSLVLGTWYIYGHITLCVNFRCLKFFSIFFAVMRLHITHKRHTSHFNFKKKKKFRWSPVCCSKTWTASILSINYYRCMLVQL